MTSEADAVEALKTWLKACSCSVYIGSEFSVHGGNGRPDMVVFGLPFGASAIEAKTSEPRNVLGSEKIISYALKHVNGAAYKVNGEKNNIKNFLVATELSIEGRLFKDDVYKDPKEKRKKAKLHERYPYIEPRFEYQRTHDFVRGIWRLMRNLGVRESLEEVNVGALLSTVNDGHAQTEEAQPKIFVMHFVRNKGRWQQLWK